MNLLYISRCASGVLVIPIFIIRVFVILVLKMDQEGGSEIKDESNGGEKEEKREMEMD